jgi:hypothetical protein
MVETIVDPRKSTLPEEVSQYLVNFYNKFVDGDSVAVHGLYESGFTRIAERFYKSCLLPQSSVVRELLRDLEAKVQRGTEADDDDESANAAAGHAPSYIELFMLLYQELGYRHMHMRLHPTLKQRSQSWSNYLALFAHFAQGHLQECALPASWLWDLIDEFLYQFEDYHQYRARSQDGHTLEELETENMNSMWNVRTTLEILSTLVEKSGIVGWLREAVGAPKPDDNYPFASVNNAAAATATAEGARAATAATGSIAPAARGDSAEETAKDTGGGAGEASPDNIGVHEDDAEDFRGAPGAAEEDEEDMANDSEDQSLTDADEDLGTLAPERCLAADSLLYRYLGYFAMVGLLRLHCATGDFFAALSVLDPPSLFETEWIRSVTISAVARASRQKPIPSAANAEPAGTEGSLMQSTDLRLRLHTHVTACHVAVYYYIGFSALMLRRYEEAIRALQPTIVHITRTKHIHVRSFQYEQVNKRIDQMLALLSLAQCLGRNRLDDSMNSWLREKLGDRTTRIRQGDLSAFEELYNHACPKFLQPSVANTCREVFLQQVAQSESGLPAQLSSYLRIYRTIDVQKLSQYLGLGGSADHSTEQVLAALFCLKYRALLRHRAATASASGSPALGTAMDSEYIGTNDTEFVIDDVGMVDVFETRTGKRPEDYFLRNIPRLGEQVSLYRRIQRDRLAATAAAFAQKEQARQQRESEQRKAQEKQQQQQQQRLDSEQYARLSQAPDTMPVLPPRPLSLAERLAGVERSH